jgi:hypothetical protein
VGDDGMRFAATAIVAIKPIKNALDMTYSRYEAVNGFANLNSLFRNNYAVCELLSHYF